MLVHSRHNVKTNGPKSLIMSNWQYWKLNKLFIGTAPLVSIQVKMKKYTVQQQMGGSYITWVSQYSFRVITIETQLMLTIFAIMLTRTNVLNLYVTWEGC